MKIKCPHCDKELKSDNLCKHVRSITFADALGEKYISGILFEPDVPEPKEASFSIDVSKTGSWPGKPPLDVATVTAVTNAMRKVNVD